MSQGVASTTLAPDHTASEDPLRPERCPHCEYSLTGSPREGACPECGEAYDADTIELSGTACGNRVTVVNAGRDHLLWTLLPRQVLAFVLVGMAAAYVLRTWGGASTVFLPTLFILLYHWGGAGLGFARRAAAGRGSVRVRFNLAGIVQDDDADEPAWSATMRAVTPYCLLAVAVALTLWSVLARDFMLMALGPLIALNVWVHWHDAASIRRAILRAPDGPRLLPVRRHSLLLPRPWAEIERFSVESIDAERCRIRASASHMRLGYGGDVVDAEVRCNTAQAAALQARARAWKEYWRNVDAQHAAASRASRRSAAVTGNAHDER